MAEIVRFFLECVLISSFVMATIGTFVEVQRNIKNNEKIEPVMWITPGLLFGFFWFLHNISLL